MKSEVKQEKNYTQKTTKVQREQPRVVQQEPVPVEVVYVSPVKRQSVQKVNQTFQRDTAGDDLIKSYRKELNQMSRDAQDKIYRVSDRVQQKMMYTEKKRPSYQTILVDQEPKPKPQKVLYVQSEAKPQPKPQKVMYVQ